ncbi:hypothetical protein BDW74DRAFT_18715 [Aspergillus multicolor]|uniref:uncharacterized protein n=1 Tax=Aspergillus multicolor TaxID=41759 RepID=UPI003CCDD2C7
MRLFTMLLTFAPMTTLAMPNFFLYFQDSTQAPEIFKTPVNDRSSACPRACFNDKPACPENMNATRLDDSCWTCCLTFDGRHAGNNSETESGINEQSAMDARAEQAPDGQSQDCHLQRGQYCCTATGCAYCCPPYICNCAWWEWEGKCEYIPHANNNSDL